MIERNPDVPLVFNYGGGRQTVGMIVLIAKGVLPRPDYIVMADTSRENTSTWEYLETYIQPFLAKLDLKVEVAPHELSTVDLYSGAGGDALVIPAYAKEGKLETYCSGEWKRRVVDRYLRNEYGVNGGDRWIGFGFEERRRWIRIKDKTERGWTTRCPLVDLMLNTDALLHLIGQEGWPEPKQSSCWMCPHKRNREWRDLRDNYPEDWKKAIELDAEIRENDDQAGLFLHHTRVPLPIADIDVDESKEKARQCSLGLCFV